MGRVLQALNISPPAAFFPDESERDTVTTDTRNFLATSRISTAGLYFRTIRPSSTRAPLPSG